MIRELIPRMILHVRGADADARQRGIIAARAVLTEAGMEPAGAALAYALVQSQGYGMTNPEQYDAIDYITEEHYALARIWEAAEDAAIRACCGDGAERPWGAFLEYRTRPATEIYPERERQAMREAGHGDELWWLED